MPRQHATSEAGQSISHVRILPTRAEQGVARGRFSGAEISVTNPAGQILPCVGVAPVAFSPSDLRAAVAEVMGGRSASNARQRHSSARDDRRWFYSDPDRVRGYAGAVVAISGCQIVGAGTAQEAASQARLAGVRSPLLIRVLTPEELAKSQMGL